MDIRGRPGIAFLDRNYLWRMMSQMIAALESAAVDLKAVDLRAVLPAVGTAAARHCPRNQVRQHHLSDQRHQTFPDAFARAVVGDL